MKPAFRPRGVTTIEALIALVIVALGLLSFIALQARMRLNTDVSRQRSEAVRVAQENMENFRAFGTLANDGSVANNFSYAGVADGASAKTVLASSVSTTTNATYTVTQSVATSTNAGMKEITVAVAWKDRESQDQSVTLRSFIAGVDPRLAAALSIPPNGSPVKDPLGRDLRVPIPAKDLGDGKSVFKPNNGGTLAFVFDNNSGAVTGKCTAVPTTVSTQQLTAGDIGSTYGCSDVNGLLLSGYVRFSLGNSPDASAPNDVTKPLSMRIDLDSTAPPTGAYGTVTQLTAAYWPTSAQSVWVSGYTSPDCDSQDSKVVRYTAAVSYSQSNNGTTQTASSTYKTAVVPLGAADTAAGIAPYVSDSVGSISNVVDLAERFIAYSCVVYPRDFSGTKAWTGRSMLVPSGWTIGTSSTAFKVCRYSEDYDLDGQVWTTSGSNVSKIDNAEHPYAYLFATIGLNNQNFLVVKGNKNCPTDGDTEVDGTGAENYTDETTVVHQY